MDGCDDTTAHKHLLCLIYMDVSLVWQNRVRATFVNDAVHGQVEQSTAVPNPKLAVRETKTLYY